jgi:hypothetical protein
MIQGRRSSKLLSIWILVGAGVLAAACRTTSEIDPIAPGHALCPVCTCSGDLACQDVTIGPETPHSSFQGTTYYFCSAQCKKDFDRRAASYLAH